MAERQRIIETNRSLRTIKNELESLLEKGMISDHSYESIHALLPSESPLSSAPTPASTASRIASPPAPAANLAALSLNNSNSNSNSSRNTPQPPSYAQTTGNQPPALPTRNSSQPAPPPTKPVIAHARALYAYHAADSRDCSFERDDRVAVYEYMNADWWMGRNERTGQEGIFPKTYVDVVPENNNNNNNNNGYGEKAGYAGYGAPVQPAYGGYPPPPAGQNPYNANVPPMAVAEQGNGAADGKHGKGQEMGKKFGKKLGNAAIFGAGATIGSNLVNSIF